MNGVRSGRTPQATHGHGFERNQPEGWREGEDSGRDSAAEVSQQGRDKLRGRTPQAIHEHRFQRNQPKGWRGGEASGIRPQGGAAEYRSDRTPQAMHGNGIIPQDMETERA
jgi:hypothetical protein